MSIAYKKPAYYAYRNLISLLDHRFQRLPILNYTTNSDSSISVFAFQHKVNKFPLVFIWMDGSIPSNDHQFINTSFTFENIIFSNPVLVDLLSGNVYEISDMNWSYNKKISIFEKIPVYDSPVVLADKAILQVKK